MSVFKGERSGRQEKCPVMDGYGKKRGKFVNLCMFTDNRLATSRPDVIQTQCPVIQVYEVNQYTG